MDLRQLRYFIALNQHRSFVRAADAIGITQPAFSRSIQSLEQEFGCVLVDRASKDLRPTPEGQVVLQHALSLVRGASNLTHEIHRMTKLDAGELQLGCGPGLSASLLPDTLLAFMARYPRIHTQVEIGNWEQLHRSLAQERLEFCLADLRHCEALPGLDTQPLRPRQGGFFCRPGHPLLAKESLSTNDLFDYPLAAARIPASVRKTLAAYSGKTDLNVHLECEQLSVLSALLARSDAIAITTREALRAELESGELVVLQPRNLPTELESFCARYAIVTRSGYRLSPAAKAMLELIQTIDQQQAA